jgi:fibronectin-binding autotransporter adhesin
MKRRLFTSLLAATPVFALAQTFVWDGGGADDNFGTGQNWNPDGAPGVGSGVVLSFTGATRPNPVNNYAGGSDSFGEWRLASGAGSDFNVSGQILRLHGKIENDAGSGRQFSLNTASIISADGTMEINPVGGNIVIGASTPIYLDNNATLNVFDGNNGRTLTINGALDNGNGTGGNGSLIVNQTATVVLTGTGNDYGATTIGSAATLRVGDGSANGALGQGGVTNNGTLIFNRGAASSYNQGATVSGTGTFRVQSGTVVGTTAQSFGASGAKMDIQSGGAVNLSGQNRSAVPFDLFASGTGDSGSGAIFNSGGALYSNSGIRNVTLTGPATFVVGGTGEGSRYDFSSTGTLTLNGNALTKAGGGNLVVRSTPAAAGGTINVTAGTLGFEDNFTGANTAAYTINVSANGAYVGGYNGRAIQSNINLSNLGGIYSQGGTVSTWSGTVNLGTGGGQVNTGNIVYSGSDITVSGPVTGGTLTVNGGNRVILSNAGNTYSSGTELLGGTLEVPAINRIGSGYLAVKNGATFQWTNGGRRRPRACSGSTTGPPTST